MGGRGYCSQQQVADLRHWLAALANPLDEMAVYSVLGSPLAGFRSTRSCFSASPHAAPQLGPAGGSVREPAG